MKKYRITAVILIVLIFSTNLSKLFIDRYKVKPYMKGSMESVTIYNIIDNKKHDGTTFSNELNNYYDQYIDKLASTTYTMLNKKDGINIMKCEKYDNTLQYVPWEYLFNIFISELSDDDRAKDYLISQIVVIKEKEEYYLLVIYKTAKDELKNQYADYHISGYSFLHGEINSNDEFGYVYAVYKADNAESLSSLPTVEIPYNSALYTTVINSVNSYNEEVAYGFFGYCIYFSPTICGTAILVIIYFILKKHLKNHIPQSTENGTEC